MAQDGLRLGVMVTLTQSFCTYKNPELAKKKMLEDAKNNEE
jgi:hypothetical protein